MMGEDFQQRTCCVRAKEDTERVFSACGNAQKSWAAAATSVRSRTREQQLQYIFHWILMAKIRVLIADDHDVVRSGLRALLRSGADFAAVAEAVDGEDAVRLAAKFKPDVVLMDISMPNLDGI